MIMKNIVMELAEELPSGMGSYQVTADSYFGAIDSANVLDESGFEFNMVITNPRVCQDFEEHFTQGLGKGKL